jgi:hypothetical protein
MESDCKSGQGSSWTVAPAEEKEECQNIWERTLSLLFRKHTENSKQRAECLYFLTNLSHA